jgi:hypothetical protein
VGEDGLDREGVLDGGDNAQPAATAGTSEDIEGEHAMHHDGARAAEGEWPADVRHADAAAGCLWVLGARRRPDRGAPPYHRRGGPAGGGRGHCPGAAAGGGPGQGLADTKAALRARIAKQEDAAYRQAALPSDAEAKKFLRYERDTYRKLQRVADAITRRWDRAPALRQPERKTA